MYIYREKRKKKRANRGKKADKYQTCIVGIL
jgi:hypothetical protein